MAAAKGSLLLLCVLGCALACAAAAATPSPQPSSSPSPAAGPATSQNAPYVDVPADTSSIIEQLAIRPRIHTQPPRRLLQLTPAADPTGDSTPTSATAALQAQGLAQPPTPRAGLLATAAAALFGAQVAGALISSNSDNWNYRIIGGKPAPPARYKWFCSLRSATTGNHYCGCSLIAPNAVLTAAHCLDQSSNSLRYPTIEVGRYLRNAANTSVNAIIDNSFDRARCVKPVIHPQWVPDTALNDLAICFFDGTSRFEPVRLAVDEDLPAGTELTVMGFGATVESGSNTETLLQTNVTVVDLKPCNASYDGMLRDTQICAGVPEGGKDACQGDSGGPLFEPGANGTGDVQFGIVSFGSGCGRKDYPGVYTDVRKYSDWIQRELIRAAPAVVASAGAQGGAGGGGAQAAPAPNAADSAAANAAANTPAAANAAAATGPCDCTTTGVSGGANVGKIGCKQHGLEYGDTSFFCYVVDPRLCSSATQSVAYAGAAFIDCVPPAAASRSPSANGSGALPASRSAAAVVRSLWDKLEG